MSYEIKHKIRKKLIAEAKKIDPKVKADSTEYSILINLKKKKMSYLDILDHTRALAKAILKTPGMKEAETEEGEFSFQFRGSGVDISLNCGREGISIYLCESDK